MSTQPIVYHCSCGADLHPYVIIGALYHEAVVALDTEDNFVRHFAPPTDGDRDRLGQEAYADWTTLYHGDLVYAASFAVVEAWVAVDTTVRQRCDLVNPDGTRRYVAPPHARPDSEAAHAGTGSPA